MERCGIGVVARVIIIGDAHRARTPPARCDGSGSAEASAGVPPPAPWRTDPALTRRTKPEPVIGVAAPIPPGACMPKSPAGLEMEAEPGVLTDAPPADCPLTEDPYNEGVGSETAEYAGIRCLGGLMFCECQTRGGATGGDAKQRAATGGGDRERRCTKPCPNIGTDPEPIMALLQTLDPPGNEPGGCGGVTKKCPWCCVYCRCRCAGESSTLAPGRASLLAGVHGMSKGRPAAKAWTPPEPASCASTVRHCRHVSSMDRGASAACAGPAAEELLGDEPAGDSTVAHGSSISRSNNPKCIRTAPAACFSASSCGSLEMPRNLANSPRARIRPLSSTAASMRFPLCNDGSSEWAASSNHDIRARTVFRPCITATASGGKPASEQPPSLLGNEGQDSVPRQPVRRTPLPPPPGAVSSPKIRGRLWTMTAKMELNVRN
mmetsp:Transcript_46643/g.134327  ORF Transcript_46643/g.134327 Transcript_46643/m.134327 type:complete len:435 (-) Transcript_46643:784-2088(-)